MEENLQTELTWAGGCLLFFVGLLVYGGTSDFIELSIVITAFVINWTIVSYSIKFFGTGSSSKKDMTKELQVFAIILIIFLGVLTFAGVKDYTTFVIATGAFTVTWLTRSTAIKYFSQKTQSL